MNKKMIIPISVIILIILALRYSTSSLEKKLLDEGMYNHNVIILNDLKLKDSQVFRGNSDNEYNNNEISINERKYDDT